MFGRSPNKSSNKQRREQAVARPLSASVADRSAAPSRRRNMAFMKYGSEQTRDSSTKQRTIQHSKKIAMSLGEDISISSSASTQFADFGSVFSSDDPFASKQERNGRNAFESDPFASRNDNLFDEDPFSEQQQRHSRASTGSSASGSGRQSSNRRDKAEVNFAHGWPSESQTMTTLPANSSMQSRFVQEKSLKQTPERSTNEPSYSPNVTMGSGGGPAARRRMRTQMRQSNNKSMHRSESDSLAQTPPQSPYSMKRFHSSDSIGSASKGKTHDHVSNYSMTQRAPVSANRSVGSTRSVTSSNSSSEANLFDTNQQSGGLTFDAFGLDASQINREDPTDDFAAGRWDSPVGSRASTPGPVEEDGFVDGFRVTKTAALPVNIKQSPTSTERSSLTSEGSDRINHSDGRVNLFKEKAGFHESRARKVVRPSEDKEHLPDFRAKSQKKSPQMPKMPHLEDVSPVRQESPNRRQPPQNVDFFDADGFSDHSARSIEEPGDSNFVLSDAEEIPSDVGVTSDFAPGSDVADVPVQVISKSSKKQSLSQVPATSAEHPVSLLEEKKDEYDESSPKSSYQDLKARWEKNDAVRRSQEKRLEQRQQQQLPSSLSQDTIDRLQNQLGDEILSPERLQQRKMNEFRTQQDVQTGQCVEERLAQRSSFASQEHFIKSGLSTPDKRDVSTKSEGGASLKSSHVNAILSRVDKESPRDSQSDTGAPSPAFANVRLRKTGRVIDPSQPSDPAAESDYSGSFGALSPKQDRDEVEPPEQHEPLVEKEAQMPTRKMSYRERRELELQKEREEEERRQSEAHPKAPELDVASLIKRRIAANKKNGTTAEIPVDDLRPGAHLSSERLEQDIVKSRRPASLVDNESRQTAREERRSELVIEPSSSHEVESTGGDSSTARQDSAVARLLMLQQIQQQQASERQIASPTPKSPDRSSVHSSGTGDERRRAQTPKATMMMLNAFLHGRESLSSSTDAVSLTGKSTQSEQEGEAQPRSSERSVGGEASAKPANSLPALKDDPKYEKYFKMLKIGMPLEVVKHSMTRDGLDASVMDGDHNKPVGIPLKDDPKYTKYFKMFKIGLPMEAVKHAMERDGLDSTVMDQDHDLPVQNGKKKEQEEPKEKDSHRRARLHWKTLRKVTSNSLWAQIDEDEELDNIEIDEQEFKELFQLEKSTEHALKATPAAAHAKRGAVRVIDPKRANNGGIILARLKMSHDDMADAVDRINEHAMTAEQIEHIIEYLPSKEECKALEAYMLEGGQDAGEKFEHLCECEKFMVSMMTVKHAKRKVRALLFKLQFQTCLEDLHRDTQAVMSACDELSNSVRLRQLLGIILTFGNRLNTAGSGKKRRAGAFTLDSLLKLNQAKAFDKKTTFLHYIVLIVQRNNELLLKFKDDLPTVFKADKVFWDQCLSDLEEVENQLENVRKIALYQARHTHAYRVRKKKREDDEESLGDGDVSLTLEEEVEALRATPIGLFTLSAIKYVSSLRDMVEQTKAKFALLLEYFGEEDKDMQPHDLFSTIVTFCRDFDKAKDQVFEAEKKKKREERKRQAKERTPNGKTLHGKPPTYCSPAQTGRKTINELKASNHQPSMSDVLQEMKRRSPPPEPRAPPHSAVGKHRHQLSGIEESPVGEASSPLSPVRQHSEQLNGTVESPPRRTPEKLTQQENTLSPQDCSSPQSASSSRSASLSGQSALREKARMRRMRYSNERSLSSPTSLSSHESNPNRRPDSPGCDDILGSYDGRKSHSTVSPARSDSALRNGAGAAQQLSPRSSMRNKRRMEMQRKMRQEGMI